MSGTFSLLTATCAADAARFGLLRESLRHCGVTAPHLAVVQTEDLPAFADLPDDPMLTLVSTREVLPASIERQRAAHAFSRSHWRHWMARQKMPGWQSQQLAKLAAAAAATTDAVVVIDSDCVVVSPLTSDDVLLDGLPRFFIRPGAPSQLQQWNRDAERFLGVNPPDTADDDYMHYPVVWGAQSVRNMRAFIEMRTGKPWLQAMAEVDVYEYSTYAAFVREVEAFKNARVSTPLPAVNIHSFEQLFNLDAWLGGISSDTKVVAMQSRLGVPPVAYAPLLREHWHGLDDARQ